MIRTKHFFSKITLSIFAILALSSCRKDALENSYCGGTKESPDEITIGNETGMTIIKLDSILSWGYPSKHSFAFDLPNNGTLDFEIYSYVWGSQGIGYHQSVQIKCLNQTAFLNVNPQADTTYSYIDTNYNSSNPVLMSIIDETGCEINSAGDSIISISDQLNYFNKGDVINKKYNWTYSSHAIYSQPHFGFPPSIFAEVNDTTLMIGQHFDYTCKNIPMNNGPVYIGIKVIHCGFEKCGWIKLTVSGINSAEVHLNEVAIQK